MIENETEVQSLAVVPVPSLRERGDQLAREGVALAEVGQRDSDVTRAADGERPALLGQLVRPKVKVFTLRKAAVERDLPFWGARQAALWQHASAGYPMQEVLQPLLRKILLVAQYGPATVRGVD